ncbi:MAG: endonuclease MutS2 [Oscillospiraceae bacterium]|nr:endonuclease MutS2 [Oscillospiraceae bacterium]
MELNEKSYRILELPAVLEMLADAAVSETAKEAAMAMRPSASIASVKSLLGETSAARNMISLKGSPPFSGVKDIRATVSRADKGGMLNAKELLDVAALLRSSASAMAYAAGERDDSVSAIFYLFNAIKSNKFLEAKISSAIVSEDEIADNASSDLYDIRRHLRIASDKVRQTLNKIITSPAYSKALQEPIITVRNGRYVVPVKAEQKSAVPGLVHDISSSGATHFVEPMAVVQINNEIRELMAKEKQEIERILRELSADVADDGDDLVNDFEVLAALDLIFAKGKLSNRMDAAEPSISDDMVIKLNAARHPLLPARDAVPIDVRLGGEFDTLVITGPNTGGKTVSLKTIGLLCAMAQCGLHIPAADGSIVTILNGILADIGDEQSIEQSLSTFSSHMTNIVDILANCEEGSLLLFDEMGAGTDPVEGAALAIAIIEYARKKGALIAATTHYAELKIYALTSPGVMNASCEFDVETLRPTFRLILGVPGKSNAFAISDRLGLPGEIIEDARQRVSNENVSFEDAIAGLESRRIELENDKLETSRLLSDAHNARRVADEIKKQLDDERGKAVENAKREAARILEDARRTADAVMDELRDLQRRAASDADRAMLNADKAALFRRLNEADASLEADVAEEDAEGPTRAPVAGDRVRLRGLGTFADVISVSPDGVLSLRAGIMNITARSDEVSIVEADVQPEVKRHLARSDAMLREVAASPEIDLRGMAVDEAIPVMERFLDNARLAKLEIVTVIHGKGTGVLRQAVQQCLRQQRGLKSFRLGRYGEGEDGVTIIEL